MRKRTCVGADVTWLMCGVSGFEPLRNPGAGPRRHGTASISGATFRVGHAFNRVMNRLESDNELMEGEPPLSSHLLR